MKLSHIVAGTTALLWITGASAQDTLESLMQTKQTFECRITNSVTLNYLLFLPKDYDSKSDHRWPVMLFLHGAGERGTTLTKVAVHGPPKLVKSKPEFPFILISPQCANGERWHDEALLALLDDVMGRYRTDPARVYLTGLSMGGYGTWSLGTKYAERFAAIAPICGGGEIIDILLASGKQSAALQSLGIWAFHGGKDPVVPLNESERMIAVLKRVGCKDVELTVYPEAGHDSWTEAYANPKLYDWFLQHARKTR